MKMAVSEKHDVEIPAGDTVVLEGTLVVPSGAHGVVLFAHGSGSGRYSPRNRYVASFLQSRGLATLLMDLLTSEEEDAERWTHHLRFDIALLARRVVAATAWLTQDKQTRTLEIGVFGASTGAAAALVAAADAANDRIGAVVSRGGRPDLARAWLRHVHAPTLLVVGGDDEPVLGMNREAFGLLQCEKKLEIIPGATHLFEEPGALQSVAQLASGWFLGHIAAHEPARTEKTGTWPT
jgi:putative phosphoribosyl transferase